MMLDLENWMGQIDDNTPLIELFIPGTHDTMTASCEERYYKTQTMSLEEQLNAGVRFLDIRLRREMIAAHREWHSDITANDILETVSTFLDNHPTETIIMRLQNANELKDDYEEYGLALHREIATFLPRFYSWPTRSCSFPKLHEIRGKIIALECSPLLYHFHYRDGIHWAQIWHENEFINLQDLWDGPSIKDKQEGIENNLSFSENDDTLHLNHISATNGDLGYPDAYANILNKYLEGLFEHQLNGRGVQILDFVTTELSHKIVAKNF